MLMLVTANTMDGKRERERVIERGREGKREREREMESRWVI